MRFGIAPYRTKGHLDRSYQPIQVKGLLQQLTALILQDCGLLVEIRIGGADDDGDLSRLGVQPDQVQDLAAGLGMFEANIQNDQIRLFLPDQRSGGTPLRVRDHPEALLGEEILQQLEEGKVIIDHNNHGLRHAALLLLTQALLAPPHVGHPQIIAERVIELVRQLDGLPLATSFITKMKPRHVSPGRLRRCQSVRLSLDSDHQAMTPEGIVRSTTSRGRATPTGTLAH
jgi:hypothetical protein